PADVEHEKVPMDQIASTIEDTTDMDCPICRDTMSSRAGVRTNACYHAFCLECLGTWVVESQTCPYCRTELF
ncbi:hypothetical protein BDV95DRAFT_467456, partial [Massariosphaeria phaeospora]